MAAGIPYCALPQSARGYQRHGECRLLATAPFDQFMLRLKVGMAVGIKAGLPGVVLPAVGVHHAWSHEGARFLHPSKGCCSSPVPYWPTWCCPRRWVFVDRRQRQTALPGDRYFGFLLNLLVVPGVTPR